MNTLNKIMAGVLVAGAALTTSAQDLRTSYFMETSAFRHQINPAYLTPYVSFPLLGNINIETTGKHGGNSFIFEIDPAQNNGRKWGTFLHPEVTTEMFLNKLGNKEVRLGANLNYNIASVAFRGFNGVNLIELNLRSNTDAELPNELFQLAKNVGGKDHYDLSDLAFRTHNYAELVFGHTHQLDDHFTFGAKAKVLFGLGYADLDVNRLDLTLAEDVWRVTGDAKGAIALMKTKFKTKEDGQIDELEDFKGGLTGMGLALDMGITYKVHSLENLTLSASLTDLGFISHSSAQLLSTKPNATWEFNGFENAYVASDKENSQELGDEFKKMGDDLIDMLNLYDTNKTGKAQALATTFNLGAEYKLPTYDKLSFGALFTQRMAGRHSWSNLMLNARIRPIQAIEVGVSSNFATTGTSLGAMATFNAPGFQFYMGTDRFFSKLSKQGIPVNSMNSSFNFGFVFPMK